MGRLVCGNQAKRHVRVNYSVTGSACFGSVFEPSNLWSFVYSHSNEDEAENQDKCLANLKEEHRGHNCVFQARLVNNLNGLLYGSHGDRLRTKVGQIPVYKHDTSNIYI